MVDRHQDVLPGQHLLHLKAAVCVGLSAVNANEVRRVAPCGGNKQEQCSGDGCPGGVKHLAGDHSSTLRNVQRQASVRRAERDEAPLNGCPPRS